MERIIRNIVVYIPFFRNWFLRYFLPIKQRNLLLKTCDPVRFGSILLAIKDIEKNNIKGAFAETGVYRGGLSKFIHDIAPEKTFYLFDTFEGFQQNDLEELEDEVERFQDTSVDLVKKKLVDLNNIIFKKGHFPDTTQGLENERFSFVMIDFDLYKPTLAALDFFYPRMNSGGYIFLHDYNSPESYWAVSRAVNEYMINKPEKMIQIPDVAGSVIIRKI